MLFNLNRQYHSSTAYVELESHSQKCGGRLDDSGDVGRLDLLDDCPADGALVVPLGHPKQGTAAEC